MIVLDRGELGLGAERLFFHAETQASMLPSTYAEAPSHAAIPDRVLANVAAQELRRRANRSAHLPPALFGEGGWDILLELFVAQQNGRRMPLSSVCVTAHVAQATAVRYIAFMISKGLFQRCKDPEGTNSEVICLTVKGLAGTRAVLEEYVCGAAN